eukprot:gb/GEZN01014764.1/.p1 GENE.gb/GEZN01014764.1/~~gb/GEZN01014764.1/.p1  ORF type:complete len:225 (-),score=17.61 gb/GEZN01014764.1/:172-846(-)
MKKTTKRKLRGVVMTTLFVIGFTSIYGARKEYLANQEFQLRMQYLKSNNVPLSGVRVCERPARFGVLNFVNHLLPFHLSLMIPDVRLTPGRMRNVGLGHYSFQHPQNTGEISRRATQWKHHDEFYDGVYTQPVEAWVDFRNTFQEYPMDVDVQCLNEITSTPDELVARGASGPNPGILSDFLSPVPDHENQLFHCRWAALDAVRKCSKRSTPDLKKDPTAAPIQ